MGVTTLDSTLRTFPSRKSVVATSAVTPRTILLRRPSLSTPRSLSWSTLDRFQTATLQCLTATPHTLPASSTTSTRSSIVVPPRRLRTTQSSSRRTTHAWPSWYQPSQCVSMPSSPTHHSDASLSVTCVKPSLSVSSRMSRSLTRLPRHPRSKHFTNAVPGLLFTQQLRLYQRCAFVAAYPAAEASVRPVWGGIVRSV